MIIEVLVCRPDGTQEMIQREVPEDWYPRQAAEDSGGNETEPSEADKTEE